MDPFYLFLSMSFVLSVSCSLVVTCWERADLLALLYVMYLCVVILCFVVRYLMSALVLQLS